MNVLAGYGKWVKRVRLIAEDCARVGNDLYFVSTEYNIVFKVGIFDGKLDIIDSIPEEAINSKRLCSKIVVWKNCIILAPMNGKKIWKYSLIEKKWKGYELKKIQGLNDLDLMFQAVIYNEKIFFIGCNYPAITIFDPNSEQIEYVEDPYLEYKDLEFSVEDVFFRTDYVMKDSFLYIASCLKNTVLRFDLDSYRYDYIELGTEKNRFSGIAYDEECFYITPRKKGPLIIWDGKEYVNEIALPYRNARETLSFVNVVYLNNSFILAMGSSAKDEYSFIVENKNKNTEKSIMPIDERYYFYRKVDDDLYVNMNESGELSIFMGKDTYKYNIEISEERFRDYIIEKKRDKKNWAGLSAHDDFVRENEIMSLNLFLTLL